MITLYLDNLTGRAPLYFRYPGQSEPQPAYVEMTESSVSADFSGAIGGGVPFDVWHRVTLRWPVSPYVRGESLIDLLYGDARPLLGRVADGHSVTWNGSNKVGVLDADATDASESLQALLDDLQGSESAIAPVWDASEWLFASSNLLTHWPSGSLDAVVAELQDAADTDGVVLDGDIEQALLTEARRVFDEADGILTDAHLAALVEGHELTQAQADEYRSDRNSVDETA